MSVLISLKITPEIYQELEAVKAELESLAKEALSLACTEDTVREVKKVRTELHHRYQDLEVQRKALKSAYMKPYDEFNLIYKTVTDSLTQADKELKNRIDTVTQSLLEEKTSKLQCFFTEQAQVLDVPWVQWEQIGCRVVNSGSDKKYREQISLALEQVVVDLSVVNNLPNRDLVTSFYMQNLQLSLSIALAEEQERAMEVAKQRIGQALAQAEEDTAREDANRAMLEELAEPELMELIEPVAVPMEEMAVATFTVTATKTMLLNLKKFLDDGGYQYE